MKLNILLLLTLSLTNGTKSLKFEVFSQNEKIGEAVWHFQDVAAQGVRVYKFLSKTVVDSVFCIFDKEGMPFRVRRHQVVAILAREPLSSLSQASYFDDSVVVNLMGGARAVFRDTLPLIDFDMLPFVIPKLLRPKTGDSLRFIMVFPMAGRTERCVAKVGKGEIVQFAGRTIKTYRIEIARDKRKPIELWIGEDGYPVRYYDRNAEFQFFRKF